MTDRVLASRIVAFLQEKGCYKAYYDNGAYLGELLIDVDGYYKWWPNDTIGCLNEGFLLEMHNRLTELNTDWDAQVCNGLKSST